MTPGTTEDLPVSASSGALPYEAVVLETAADLVRELHPDGVVAVALDTSLERELGFDSLTVVEFVARLESVCGVVLADSAFATVETPRDLLAAIEAVRPRTAPPKRHRRQAMPAAARMVPHSAATLLDALAWHINEHAARVHIRYLEGDSEVAITYADLADTARGIAAGLQARDVHPGTLVAIMLPTGPAYFAAFFGALMAGTIPCPVYPPARLSQIEEHLVRQAGILDNARARVLIVGPQVEGFALRVRRRVASLDHVVTPVDLAGSGTPSSVDVGGDATALVQYTSGSTGAPKGVVLSHANLLANIRAMGEVAEVTSTDVFVSWLPLYHDMGLIGAWLGSLYFGFPLVVMSPLTFLAHPLRWLWAIHEHRGTLSAAPNFGYELCLRRGADTDLGGLDLSSWRMAFNGAEPVSPHTLERFAARYAPYGLRRDALAPVYGLAEGSVGLAFPPTGRGPVIDRVDRRRFETSRRAQPAPADDPTALRFVACGRPLPGHEIRVVDAAGGELPDREEGRIHFRGPSATRGYLNNSDATARLRHGDWLDTGDLGYLADGDVYVTGRVKDIVIRAGRNIHPEEVEAALGNVPGIRAGCVAAFAGVDPRTGTERLVIVAETRARDPAERDALRARAQGVVVDLLDIPADEIVIAGPRTIPKTSSGKIRRSATRERFEAGDLGRVRGDLLEWTKSLAVLAAGMRPRLGRAGRMGGRFAYGLLVWAVFLAVGIPTWLLVAVLPLAAWRRRLVQTAARRVLLFADVPVVAHGLDNLPSDRPCVIVANHTSLIDSLVLAALLPVDYGFVAASELADHIVTGIFLRRLGTVFVHRSDRRRAISEMHRAADVVAGGHSIVVFPEGGLDRAAGLRTFRLGAFVVAAEVGAGVVPFAITGTRDMLRPGQRFVRPGRIEVHVGPPLEADGTGWSAALDLQRRVRAAILGACREPDLA